MSRAPDLTTATQLLEALTRFARDAESAGWGVDLAMELRTDGAAVTFSAARGACLETTAP